MLDFDLDSPDFHASPTETLDALRRHAPVHFHEPLKAYVLTRYEDVARVVRDPAFSVDRGGLIGRSSDASVAAALAEANRYFGLWMVFSDPPRHARLRQLLASAFTPARMRAFGETIDAFLDSTLAGLADRGETFDLVTKVAEPLPARMTSTILGLPEGAESMLHRYTDDFFAFFGAADSSADIVLAAQRAIHETRSFFADVLADRRRDPGDDVFSHVVRSELDSPTLDEDALLGLAMTLVAGAYGTTTHLIGHSVALALTERDVYAQLVRDPSLAAGIVEETFRVDGPALSVVRRTTTSVELSGVRIPADARIYCMLHAANHDPEVFPDPGRFDPRRSPNRHLGLGAGPHFCLGASLTRLEATRTLMALARRLPRAALAAVPRRAGNLSMRGLTSLEVAPDASARRTSADDIRTNELARPTAEE